MDYGVRRKKIRLTPYSLDFLRFSPQPLEAVEFAGFVVENMGDHGAKVQKHPLPLRQTFDMEGRHLALLHLIHKMHRDGLHMPVAIPMTDQEIMRDTGVSGNIKKHGVFGLLVFRKRS
jgi:hypothetical protein